MMNISRVFARRFSVAMLAATCLCAPARAGGNLYVFGDSLADDGNTPKFGIDYPPPPYSNYRFSNGPVFSQYLGPLTGLNVSPANNYAVGGAFAGPLSVLGTTYNNLENLPPVLGEPGFPVQLPSFLSEVTEFQATGTHFSNSDVVAVWVGANDYFATLALVNAGLANPTTAITNAVTTVATQISTGVTELNALGAQRFLVFDLPPLGLTPEFNQDGAAIVAETDEVSAAHDSTLADYMNGVHTSTGANIIVVNTTQLFKELLANPAAYGKTNTTQACIDVLSCVTASTAVQNQYVFWDTVHPTTGTHAIIAAYAAGDLNGLAGLAAPAQVAAYGAEEFSTQLNARLDSLRAGASGFSFDAPGESMVGQVGSGHKLSGFFSGGYDYGNRNTIGADNGFTYNIASFAAGLDYALAPGVAVGVALGYGDEHGSVTEAGNLKANTYEFGAYAAFYQANYYLDLSLGYGFDDFDNTRNAVLPGSITAKPAGNTITLGAETGYVLHAGGFSYGPVAGISVDNSSLGTYTETGDPALTQAVNSQVYSQVIADLGATEACAFALGPFGMHQHITLTADHLVSGNGGNFTSVFTDEPLVSLMTTYPDQTKTWAEISGGLAANLTPRLALAVDLASTLGKSDGADHEFNGSLQYRF
jgi:outer membrane lipase/esterase